LEATKPESRRLTTHEVLHARCDELALEAVQGFVPIFATSEREPSDHFSTGLEESRSVPLAFFAIGIMPCGAGFCRRTSMLLRGFLWLVVLASSVGFFLLSFGYVFTEICAARGIVCWQRRGFLSEVPLPIGAIVALATVSFRGHRCALEETLAMLHDLSVDRKCETSRLRASSRDKVVYIAIWLCVVAASSIWRPFVEDGDVDVVLTPNFLHGFCMAVFSGCVLSLAYGMVFVCRSLSIMIDVFCCDVVRQQSPQRAAHVWNMTQAILRKVSAVVQPYFLVLGIILVSTVPLLLIGVIRNHGTPSVAMVPALCMTCGILYMLLLAATISEQCARVPSLVNAMSFGDGTEEARQLTVNFISSSGAGFYISTMRLTTATVLKFMYIWCIVVVGWLTRLDSV